VAVSTSASGKTLSEKILVIGASGWVQANADTWKSIGYTGAELSSLEGKWVTFAAIKKASGSTNVPDPGAFCGRRPELGTCRAMAGSSASC
jgi:hypothetical protein